MDTIPSNLGTLTEELEDARQFHAGAALHSAGGGRERHREMAQVYARMLTEVRRWESDRCGIDAPERTDARAPHRESYAAMLDRVYRIYAAAVPARQSIRVRAADAGTNGDARDGCGVQGACASASRSQPGIQAPARICNGEVA